MSDYEEPNIRNGTPAVNLTGTVTCKKTSPGVKYGLYRFNNGNAGVPKHFNEYAKAANEVYYFNATSDSFTIVDPLPILSSTSVAYRCVALFN
jgi:hypothetical protein